MILAILIVCLLTVGAVSAEDNGTSDIVSADDSTDLVDCTIGEESDSELTFPNANEETLKANPKSFSDLNTKINGNLDGVVYLEENYTYDSDTDSDFIHGIAIERPVTIYGNGITIDGANSARIFRVTDSEVTFNDITFVNAYAFRSYYEDSWTSIAHIDEQYGSAIFGRSTAINCTFINNHAELYGGALYNANATGCTFISNSATQYGGAMYQGSATDCIFINNSAGRGGAMYRYSAANCTFARNYATVDGGAASTITATDCTFINNHAQHGGSLYNSNSRGHNTFILNYETEPGSDNFNMNYGEETIIDNATLTASNFISAPNSCERLMFDLKDDSGQILNGISINITVKNDAGTIATHHLLSGDEWIVNLSSGRYEATLSADHPNVQPVTATIKITDGSTFSDLNRTINAYEANEIILDKNYAYDPNIDSEFRNGIIIGRDLTLYGNGFILNGVNQARIFNVTADNAVLSDIAFVDVNATYDGSAVHWSGADGQISNCSFKFNSTISVDKNEFILTPTLEVTLDYEDIVCGNVDRQDLRYWNGTAYCEDIPVSGTFKLSNQNITLELICRATGSLAENITGRTDSNGQITFNYSHLPNGKYDYVAYYLDNDFALIKTEGSFGFYRVAGNTLQDITDMIKNANDEGYASDGDIIHLEGHNYTLENQIKINKPITIIGMDGTVLEGKGINVSSNDVTIKNIKFVSNYSVAIAIYGANCSVSCCNFIGVVGGGIRWNGTDGAVSNCSFLHCSYAGRHGGAIDWQGANGVVSDCSFSNCYNAQLWDTAGAIGWNGANGTVSNCSFLNNYAYDSEDSVHIGGAIYWGATDGIIYGCDFTDNFVISNPTRYQAIWCAGDVQVSNSSFKNNPRITGSYNNEDLSLIFNIASYLNYDDLFYGTNPKDNYYWNGLSYEFSEDTVDFGIFNFTNRNITLEVYDSAGNLIDNATDPFDNNNQFIYDYRHLPNGRHNFVAYYVKTDSIFTQLTGSFGFYRVTGNTFQDIEDTIKNAHYYDGVLLEGHTYYGNGSSIEIDKDVVIVGQNGTVLDARGLSRIFEINVEAARSSFIRNIAFLNGNDTEGGAIYSYKASFTYSNCTFVNNTASDGGVIYCRNSGGPFYECNFINNTAIRGGAVYVGGYAISVNFTDCSFVNNTADSVGGAIYWYGPAAEVHRCSFVNNTANGDGGAIYLDSFMPRIYDSIFINNTANNGGAIYDSSMDSYIYDSHFVDNAANDSGGAIYCPNLDTHIFDSHFVDNVANGLGSNLYWTVSKGDISNSTFKISPVLSVGDDDLTLTSTLEANLNYTNANYVNCVKDNLSFWNGSYVNADNPDWGIVRIPNQNITLEIYDSSGNLVRNVTRQTDINGQSKYKYTNLPDGKYNYTAYWFDDYSKVVQKGTFELSRDETELSVEFDESFVMTYKDGSSWNITLSDSSGSPIDGVVKVGIAGKVYNRATDAYGVARLPINLLPGVYDINATYDGANGYETVFVKGTVTVNKAAATLTAGNIVMDYMDGSVWTVCLTDGDGNAIDGVKVSFGVAGKVYNIRTDETGAAELPINLNPGTYEVNASLSNSKYQADSIAATITVNKATPVLSGEDLVMVCNDGSSWRITLADAGGNAIANAVVKFTVAGKTYSRKTDANGTASLPINLISGNYNISARFEGNTKFEPVEINNTVTVNKPKYNITAEDVNMTYGDGTNFTVQLVDSQANPVALAGENVKITVNGKPYNRKTDTNGIATLPINLRAGTYTFTAEYDGNEITNTIVVNKA